MLFSNMLGPVHSFVENYIYMNTHIASSNLMLAQPLKHRFIKKQPNHHQQMSMFQLNHIKTSYTKISGDIQIIYFFVVGYILDHSPKPCESCDDSCESCKGL